MTSYNISNCVNHMAPVHWYVTGITVSLIVLCLVISVQCSVSLLVQNNPYCCCCLFISVWSSDTLPVQIIVNIVLSNYINSPVPVVARSKAWVCGRLSTEIVGSNPTGCKHICLL